VQVLVAQASACAVFACSKFKPHKLKPLPPIPALRVFSVNFQINGEKSMLIREARAKREARNQIERQDNA
jgi:hypothetical protein